MTEFPEKHLKGQMNPPRLDLFQEANLQDTCAGKGAGGKEGLLGLAQSFVLNSRKRGRLVYDFWRKGIQKDYS